MTKSIYITKQQLKTLCIGVILSIIMLMFFSHNIFALKVFDDIKNGIQSFCSDMYEVISGGILNVATEIFDAGYVDSIIGEKGTAIANIVEFLKVLGIGVSLMLFTYKMIMEIQKQQDPVDSLLKNFVDFLICFLCITNIEMMLDAIDGLGSLVIDGVKVAVADAGKTIPTVEEVFEIVGFDDSIGGWLVFMFMLLIPWCVSWIGSVLARVACYSIILELGVRRAFTPFAIADIAYEGLRSQGFRYLKKYLAVYFKEAIVLLVVVVTSALQTFAIGNVADEGGMNFMANIVGVSFAGLMLIFKSADWANDIVGA